MGALAAACAGSGLRPRHNPTTSEVEEAALTSTRHEGHARKVTCHRVASETWDCSVRFTNGQGVILAVKSYDPENLGISVVRHF